MSDPAHTSPIHPVSDMHQHEPADYEAAPVPQFMADMAPDSVWPRLRFNFANGYSASIVVRTRPDTPCDAMIASLAVAPSGQWGTGNTELGPTEAFADEAIAWLAAIAAREPRATPSPASKGEPNG